MDHAWSDTMCTLQGPYKEEDLFHHSLEMCMLLQAFSWKEWYQKKALLSMKQCREGVPCVRHLEGYCLPSPGTLLPQQSNEARCIAGWPPSFQALADNSRGCVLCRGACHRRLML